MNSRFFIMFASTALVALCVGCSSKSDVNGPVGNLSSAEAIRGQLGGSEESGGDGGAAVQSTGWATFSGRFVVEGNVPAPQPKLGVNKDLATCAPGGSPPLQNDLLVGADGGLQNVAVYVRKVPSHLIHESKAMPPSDPDVFDQKNCVFQSHVFAVQVGRQVSLKNSDDVGHNTKVSGAPANQFNETIQQKSELTYVAGREEAKPVAVGCSIHPWMRAFMLPRETGYFAVTNEKGEFSIDKLPAGVTLEFQVWHERGTGTGQGLALDTPEAKAMKWNARGRFRITLTAENEDERAAENEIEIKVPPAALGV